ncbi:MAG: carboxypeptidase-like regulatory domain-containing protein, partial [Bdellovibrionaceae bacterium]|nr:carboxypeptidase-like regulatory domain-containing protein [Pseudobdellovibrionaceae bacterium]
MPAQNSKIFQYQFLVSGVSNEPLLEARVDGLVLILSADKKSFSGNYVSSTPGLQTLNIEATDLAGNKKTDQLNIDIQTKLLNPALITLFADSDSQHIFIKGITGAVRSGAEVTATTGFFNLNRETKTANSDGSFLIRLELFTSVDIKVKDLQSGETDSVTINFSPRTTISGLVKDSDGVPLPGATIKIKGTDSTAVTDGQGLFNIATISTGDQTLLIDGTSIPQSATGPYREFSKTAMVVNIGLGQSNVLSRPVYLTPSYLDGTETTVEAGRATTVTSSRAPGVTLNIPANIAKFPDGSLAGDITIATINSDRATIAVPAVAIPDTVVALEPSGLTFEERVEVSLPNENEFQPGVRLLIYSMNSSKGIWEIDGEAQVTESGDQIKTLPGKGISHFSLIYAVPMKPLITEVKDPTQLGVDVSQGSLSTAVELPSFKSLGQSVTPKLIYKSNWANPTAYVSNLFDIPIYEQAINYSSTKVKEQTKSYKVCYSLFGWTIGFTCDYQDYLIRAQFDSRVDGKAWYVPESIRAQLFVSNLASNQAIVTNVDTDGNTNIETLPGAHFDNSRQSEITTLSGIPSRSIMS